ncbi:CTD phosphatase Fcp1 [Coemansia sp. Benny D115]|nr:CTD phosphatase Fcp1 [Coemansia sp. Benny D115]
MESAYWLQVAKRHSPAKIVEIKVSVGDELAKNSPVLTYEFKEKYMGEDPESRDNVLLKALHKEVDAEGFIKKREYLRTPYEGKVTGLSCKVGDTVQTGVKLLQITVACSHDAVFNGLCGLCGKDVSGVDNTGMPNSRANIDMFHDSNGLKVSHDMAAELDADNQERLWKQRKLSLIIDLDQTIIHASPSTDSRFESYLIESCRSLMAAEEKASDAEHAAESAPMGLPKDIGTFFLPDSPFKYYIKLRPGLSTFLEQLSKLYEMHIYTMGSRTYADAVANLIDPEGRYFNRRILSRDENGSITRKNLKRLFPIDTSMVVIIDDRGDVWEWSPNLIRVHAYEFFAGVGDINAGFLPPKEEMGSPSSKESKPAQSSDPSQEATPADEQQHALQEPAVNVPDSTGNHPSQPTDAIVQAKRIEKESNGKAPDATPELCPQLTDNDRELYKIQEVLTQLHTSYYDIYDRNFSSRAPRTEDILSQKKRQVLNGVTIVFSAVFPTNRDAPPPQKSELWQWATSFGARCEVDLSPKTTHVVAGNLGTEKIYTARKAGNNQAAAKNSPIVVKMNWLLDSIYRWEHLDETPYLWYPEDKGVVERYRQQLHERNFQTRKRKPEDSDALGGGAGAGGGLDQRDKKTPRRQVSAVDRLRLQADRDASGSGYDSSNTTDIEAELKIQEAGLKEHEEEVDTYVNNIDWDDLERELMDDSESDDVSGGSRPQTPDGSMGGSGVSHSRNGSSADLRHVALKMAAAKRRNGGTASSGGSAADSPDLAMDGADGTFTDSSDVFEESDESAGGSESRSTLLSASEQHRKKRRKRSFDPADHQKAPNKRLSKLAIRDGSVGISTNTDDSDADNGGEYLNDSDLDAGVMSSSRTPGSGGVHSRLASKLGISAGSKSSLNPNDDAKMGAGRRRQQGAVSGDHGATGDSSGDEYFARDDLEVDAPLFAGIEDRQGEFEGEFDDENEFENAAVPLEGDKIKGGGSDGGYTSDSEEEEQWGEDDDSDDENFDDLINDLEEEISSQ